jgi:hypothetical protein
MTDLAPVCPKVGDICLIEYRVQGNGPWNYVYERPPNDVVHVRHIGVYFGETERDYLTAHSFGLFNDGRLKPAHLQHFTKDGCRLTIILRVGTPAAALPASVFKGVVAHEDPDNAGIR